jgi:hypothetical protein
MVLLSFKFVILLVEWKLGHLKLAHSTVLAIHAWESMIMESRELFENHFIFL